MEDRKRPASYDNDETAPPSKRQVTSGVNGDSKGPHPDADMPWKDELDRFTKDSVLRQMKEYRSQLIDAQKQRDELAKKSAHHDDHVRCIDAWFSQLLDEIKVYTGKIDDISSYSAFQSSLLSSDSKAFEEYLQSRSKAISSAMDQIFSAKSASSPEAQKLQERIAKLLAAEKGYANQLEKSLLEKSQVEERLETASMRYMMAEKKLERAKSLTVAKLERQATGGGRGQACGGDGGKSDSVNGQVDSEVLAEAQREGKLAKAASDKQKEQIEQLAAENEKLSAQLTSLTLKTSSFSDDDYAHTDLFKQLKTIHEEVVKKVNNLEALNSELRQENTKHQAERSAYRMQVDAESQAAISERELQLIKTESDLTRIRAARDELGADLVIRKAAQEQERTSISQIKQLIAARDDRIKALESEIGRLGGTPEQGGVTANSDLSVDDLRTKHSNLERQYTMLNQELSSMSAAYKKISTVSSAKVANLTELEDKVMRLGAEKSKADQKYFSAMKAKEAREQEIRSLRAQNAKSSDIVSQLKDAEASTRALIVNLEKQSSEQNSAITALQAKLRDAQGQAEQRKNNADTLKKQTEELKTLLATKDSACSAATNAQRKADVQVEELKADIAEKNKRIEIWKQKGLGSENEHYEVLRSLAICTVCRKNFKDTAIKTCGHVFCKECVEVRLQSRMRKCPNCNKGFGASDYLKITL